MVVLTSAGGCKESLEASGSGPESAAPQDVTTQGTEDTTQDVTTEGTEDTTQDVTTEGTKGTTKQTSQPPAAANLTTATEVCVGKNFYDASGLLVAGTKDCTAEPPPNPWFIRAGKTIAGVTGLFAPYCGVNSAPCGGVEVTADDTNVWRDVTVDGCEFGDECVMFSKVSRLEWTGIPYPLAVDVVSGSNVVTVTSGTTAQLRPGMIAYGGVPYGTTTIVSVDSSTSFTISANATADSFTSLDSRWPDDTMHFNRMPWATAIAYCTNLTWNGKSDWRLPSAADLHEAVTEGIYTSNIDNDWIKSNVANVNLNIMNNWYWSSSERNSSTARWVELHSGKSTPDYDDKGGALFTLCVRDGD